MVATNTKYMRLHAEALYTYDINHRITGCNQFSGGEVPRFHLARTDESSFCVFRNDVPDQVVASLQRYAQKEPSLDDPDTLPVYQEQYLELLSGQRAVEAIWHGPVYRFLHTGYEKESTVVEIETSNSKLLEAHMSDWLVDVPHRQPFMAVVEGSHAVAVCASVRITPDAHEAGVETAPSFRRRGYAAKAVAAWAKAVSRVNAEPLYSTSWDNSASQAVAQSLGLEFVGSDFHIR